MRRFLLAATLVTALLFVFAGSALADGPGRYGNTYNSVYGQYGNSMFYQRYASMYMNARCPYAMNYSYAMRYGNPYSYGNSNSMMYGGYGMTGGYGRYGSYSGYGMNNSYSMYRMYGW